MNRKISIIIVSFFFLGLSSLNLLHVLNDDDNRTDNLPENPIGKDQPIHVKNAWTETAIFINGTATGVGAHNWTWAINQDWCYGLGTFAQPYIIENVTINNGATGSCIYITNSLAYFIIRNCTLSNSILSSTNAGIRLIDAHNATIYNNTISSTQHGIYLEHSDNCTISNNTMQSININGIYLHEPSVTTVFNNTISASGYDIYLWRALSVNMGNNTLQNHGLVLSQYNILAQSNSHTINTSNTHRGKPIYYYKNTNYLRPTDFTNAGQIILSNCDHAIISDLEFDEAASAIQIYSSDNNTITSSNFTNYDQGGVFLAETVNTNISNNRFSTGTYGIYGYNNADYNNITYNSFTNAGSISIFLYLSANNNIIKYNNISDGIGNGIQIQGATNTIIASNRITNKNTNGIDVQGSSNNNNITLNNITNNGQAGVQIWINSNDNNIWENNITDNNYGVYIRKDGQPDSTNNDIWNNTFTINTVNARDDCPNNNWNNSETGNYWDDYFSGQGKKDLDDDGWGDDPYTISGTAGAQDEKPIWDDGDSIAPSITINSPVQGAELDAAPTVSITVTDAVGVHSKWYEYVGLSGNITLVGTSFQVDATIWANLAVGATLTINIYANDTSGNEKCEILTIKKKSPPSTTTTPPPPDLMPIFLIGGIIVVAILGVVIIIKRKGNR